MFASREQVECPLVFFAGKGWLNSNKKRGEGRNSEKRNISRGNYYSGHTYWINLDCVGTDESSTCMPGLADWLLICIL